MKRIRTATCLAGVLLIVYAAGSLAQSQAKGDPVIEKRGYTFLMRSPHDEQTKKLFRTLYSDIYLGQVIPKHSAQLLTVRMPPPSMGDQYDLGTYGVDCENGAVRWLSHRQYNARWQPAGEEVELKGTTWQRPVQNSLLGVVLSAACP